MTDSRRAWILLSSLSVALLVLPASAQSASFACDSRLVAVDRYPTAQPVENRPESVQNGKALSEADFAGFKQNYSLESVHFVIVFEPDKPGTPETMNPTGTLRVFARIRSLGREFWHEIEDNGSPRMTASWLQDSTTGMLLRTDFDNTPERTDSDGKLYTDPIAGGEGDPQLRIQQAEPGVPIFLLKFISLVPAGPYPDAKAETALVLDLRRGELHTPSSISCIVADYPSLPHRSDSVSCTWKRDAQDFICDTDADSRKRWSFFLIAGKRRPAPQGHRAPKKR